MRGSTRSPSWHVQRLALARTWSRAGMGAPFGTAIVGASGMAGQAGRRGPPGPSPKRGRGRAQRRTRPPAFSASWAPIGTTSPEWRPKPLFLPEPRPDLGRQEESTAARTSWPEHMPADQQGSPGYERGAHRAPREPSGEFSPRAGYRSVDHRARHQGGGTPRHPSIALKHGQDLDGPLG
jgi:hypothetical protein